MISKVDLRALEEGTEAMNGVIKLFSFGLNQLMLQIGEERAMIK